MQKHERFSYSQEYLTHGYKELTIPPGPHGEFLLEKNALHIWPRDMGPVRAKLEHSWMMIALPNRDGSFTCTLFLPFEGPLGFAALRTDDDVVRFFEHEFPDLVPLMPTLEEDFRNNPTGALVTIRCRPWHFGDRVLLLGDAAHAVVPFLGQGMNAAFEDCMVLSACLKGQEQFAAIVSQHAAERGNTLTESARGAFWESAFRGFEGQRKPHTDVLADLCVDNYLEMSARVASPAFLLKKKTEVFLHRLFPRWYLPLYTLVTFTRTPYAEAVRRARLQNRIVQTLVGVLLVLVLFVAYVLLAGGRGP
jgi:kynurenine 3-monooxygenase